MSVSSSFANISALLLTFEIGVEIAITLTREVKIHSFVLAAMTKLLAYRVRQAQITEVLELCGISHFDTVQLKNCVIEGSEVCKLFCINALNNWNVIELSGCNIRDDELELFATFSLKVKSNGI